MTCMYISHIGLNFDSGPLVVHFGAHNITEFKKIKYTGGLLKKTGCIWYITTKNVCLSTDVSAVSILNILLSIVVFIISIDLSNLMNWKCYLPGCIFP